MFGQCPQAQGGTVGVDDGCAPFQPGIFHDYCDPQLWGMLQGRTEAGVGMEVQSEGAGRAELTLQHIKRGDETTLIEGFE